MLLRSDSLRCIALRRRGNRLFFQVYNLSARVDRAMCFPLVLTFLHHSQESPVSNLDFPKQKYPTAKNRHNKRQQDTRKAIESGRMLWRQRHCKVFVWHQSEVGAHLLRRPQFIITVCKKISLTIQNISWMQWTCFCFPWQERSKRSFSRFYICRWVTCHR